VTTVAPIATPKTVTAKPVTFTPPGPRATGIVTKWTGRGFGFIERPDRLDDVFFHGRDCQFDWDSIAVGMTVEFTLIEDQAHTQKTGKVAPIAKYITVAAVELRKV
jgi:cold shock CspA family protein